MSSESATNLTVTSSQSVQHVSNCVTQLNSNSIEIHVLATILDHRVFVLDQWVFVLDQWVFVLDHRVFILDQWVFVLDHRVFVLDQWVFVLDHRVFVLDQWVFVLDHRVFGLRSSFLGLRFRHIHFVMSIIQFMHLISVHFWTYLG